MKIDSISSVNIIGRTKPVEPQAQRENAPANKSGYLKELPKNFKTLDPESFEPIEIGELELIKAIEQANETLRGATTSFKYSIHEDTKSIMVKVINSETHEVIREIPPEKVLDMVAKMWELCGIMVDRHI